MHVNMLATDVLDRWCIRRWGHPCDHTVEHHLYRSQLSSCSDYTDLSKYPKALL